MKKIIGLLAAATIGATLGYRGVFWYQGSFWVIMFAVVVYAVAFRADI